MAIMKTGHPRARLYGWMWEMPATEVAKYLGVSGTALKKLCNKHSIPTPWRGYWQRKMGGLTVERSPLPEVSEEETLIQLPISEELACTLDERRWSPPDPPRPHDVKPARSRVDSRDGELTLPTDPRNIAELARELREHELQAKFLSRLAERAASAPDNIAELLHLWIVEARRHQTADPTQKVLAASEELAASHSRENSAWVELSRVRRGVSGDRERED